MNRWMMVIRTPFLLLPLALAVLGTCAAWYDGYFHFGHAVLAFAGLLLAHISVNVLNEYHDFHSGVDFKTTRTPFSGGSGALPEGLVSSRQALILGWAALLINVPIGIYFCLVKGWEFFPLLIVGALTIVLYTPFLLKMGYPEWAPGLGLGALPVLGIYFIQTGQYTWTALAAAIPPYLLVHNLLLLNEFPDIEADKTAGRRSLPIAAGRKTAALVYSIFNILLYAWLGAAVLLGWMPVPVLLGWLTIPFAVKGIRGALNSANPELLMPGMGANVIMVLLTQVLMGLGFVLARLL
jgi:1,4-dihydroxy-2-naphthoate polyprenyltransferase